jgi:CRP-like cAMP-binding protein
MDLKTYLRTLPAFEAYSDAHTQALVDAMTLDDYPDDFVFIHQGSTDSAMFLIVHGRVSILQKHSDGAAPVLVRDMLEGESFGLLSLVDDLPAAATCIANGPVRAAALSREAFHTLVRTAPPIARQLQYMIAVQLARDLQEQNAALRARL